MSKLTKEQRMFWDTLKYSYDRGEIIRRNPHILEHIEISKKIGKITEPLAEFMVWVANRRIGKANFYNFNQKEDMVGHAIMLMTQSVLKFNPDKSDNPYAYLVTITTGAFYNYLNHERRQQELKRNGEQMAEDNVRD